MGFGAGCVRRLSGQVLWMQQRVAQGLAIRKSKLDLNGHEVFDGASSTGNYADSKGRLRIERNALSNYSESNGFDKGSNNPHDWIMDAILHFAWMAICVGYGCFRLLKCGYGKFSAWFGRVKVKGQNLVSKFKKRSSCKALQEVSRSSLLDRLELSGKSNARQFATASTKRRAAACDNGVPVYCKGLGA